jgi:hypothetical protein
VPRTVAFTTIFLVAASAAATADCSQDVNTAFDKLRAGKAFRMRTTIVNPQGSLKMTVDYVLPDRMHQKLQVTGEGGTVELIVIGTKAWSNNGQGWAEMPATFADHVSGQIRESVAAPPPGGTEFVCLGDKELAGKSYAAYRTVLSAPQSGAGASLRSSVQTVYVDKGSGLPERNIVTADSASEERLFDGTFSFPATLTIEPPATGPAP